MVQGDKTVVDAILTHDDIRAVSFVGSSDIADMFIRPARQMANVYRPEPRPSIILPDADMDQVVADIAGPPLARPGSAWHCRGGAVGDKQRIFSSNACVLKLTS